MRTVSDGVLIVVPGPVVPERKRQVPVRARGGGIITTRRVDTPQAAEAKARVAWAAREAMKSRPPYDNPLVVSVTVTRLKPTSYRKRDMVPWRRPDLSNYLKLIEDALTGVVWTDDARICMLHAEKVFGEREEIIIRVRPLDHDMQPTDRTKRR